MTSMLPNGGSFEQFHPVFKFYGEGSVFSEHVLKKLAVMDAENRNERSKKPVKGKFAAAREPNLTDTTGQANFRDQLRRMVPKVQQYLARRLSMAYLTGALSKGIISPTEIVNRVYLELFIQFEGAVSIAEDWEVMVYQVTDQVLDKEIAERDFERRHFIGLQHFEQWELSDFEEKFTIDADGELVMVEDLEDISIHQKVYDAEAVFIKEDENIEKAFLEQDKKTLHLLIKRELLSLTEKERSIFDLYWLGGLDIDRIAKIKMLEKDSIEKMLKKVTLKVKESLESRWKK